MTSYSRILLTALVAGAAMAGGAHAAGGSGSGSKLQELDTNNDGMLSRNEASAHPHLSKNFESMDLNHDGQLSRDELMSWKSTHSKKGGDGGSGKGGFSKLDTNGDGAIERSEVQNDPKSLRKFDAADMNHDGRVTADEARAARQAHKATGNGDAGQSPSANLQQ